MIRFDIGEKITLVISQKHLIVNLCRPIMQLGSKIIEVISNSSQQ